MIYNSHSKMSYIFFFLKKISIHATTTKGEIHTFFGDLFFFSIWTNLTSMERLRTSATEETCFWFLPKTKDSNFGFSAKSCERFSLLPWHRTDFSVTLKKPGATPVRVNRVMICDRFLKPSYPGQLSNAERLDKHEPWEVFTPTHTHTHVRVLELI